MGKVRRNLDLAQKPLGAEGGSEIRPEDLHRHLAVVLEVLGEIHCRHAPSADFPLDGIAVGEGSFETDEGVVHFATTLAWLDHQDATCVLR